VYTPSYESILLSVCLGRSSLGAVWETAYKNFCAKRPDLASRLVVLWRTPSLVSSGVLFRRDMDQQLSKRLLGLLLHLQDDSEGIRALQEIGISRIELADSNSYKSLKEFMREYDSVIR
jgi:ABC-type phosphate/phosphonate transport system substrate-binding protein